MKPLCLTILFVAYAFVAESPAQVRLDNWRSHSSMYSAIGAAFDAEGKLWAATSGGVFRYDLATKEFTEFRNVGALLSLDASAIYYQKQGNTMYVGSNDGVINAYSLSSDSWKYISDIKNQATLPKKRITAFMSVGARLFVGGDFGMVEYDANGVPGDYVQQFGDFPRNTPVLQMLTLNDTLWVATPVGVARAALSERSLRNPAAWRTIAYSTGLIEDNCIGFATHNGKALIASKNSIVEYNNGAFTTIRSGAGGITSISANDDDVYFTNLYFLVGNKQGNLPLNLPAFPTGHVYAETGGAGKHIIFLKDYALGIWDGDSLILVKPETPLSNQFSSLATDNAGNLWSTTANDGDNARGFSMLSNGKWKNYLAGSDPSITTNGFFKAARAIDGSMWFGTWGAGAIRATTDGGQVRFQRYADSNSTFSGIPNAPKFIVTGKAADDGKGTVWIPDFSPGSGGNVLCAMTKTGEWHGFPNGAGNSREFRQVVVDLSGTKWLASAGSGLLAFNEKGTLADKSDDFWKSITTNDVNILSNIQTALAVDKNGALWIGTPVGLAIIFNPGAVLRGGAFSVQRPSPLANQIINDIYVDPQNLKWVATNTGVFVLNEDGTQVLTTFSKSNTPLVSNEILSIALNEVDGTMYFGSKEGLSQAQTLAVQPLPEYDVSVYPQPFYPEKDTEVIIDGLAAEANIRIISPSGQPIRKLETRSRRAIWDGRDDNGTVVTTGVYVILGISSTGGKSGVGKVAVISKP